MGETREEGGNAPGAHRGCSGRRSGLGDAPETTNSTATMIGAEEGNGDVAAMQGFRGPVERWGGRGSCGGASELVGGARGGRRRRLWRTAATVVFGRERERARERKERAGESEREQGGSGRAAGVVHAARRASASRRWPRGRARASTQQLRGVGRKTTGSYSAGLASWAGQLAGPHREIFPFLFCFLFLFNISATLLN